MALELTRVSKIFGHQAVLPECSYRFENNAVHRIAGVSGAGKTTLLRLIAGLERPDSGMISWCGTTYHSDSIWVPPWQREVALQFQDAGLWGHLNAKEHLKIVQKRKITSTLNSNPTWESLLDMVELSAFADKKPGELSGGQQQRLGLARALASGKRLVLLDEPFANLDAELAMRIWEKLILIQKKNGLTLLVATHDNFLEQCHSTFTLDTNA